MNEVTILITQEMKNSAKNYAELMVPNYGKPISKIKDPYSKSDHEFKATIGRLGELVFEEFLKQNNKYFDDSENIIANQYSLKNTDLGDFYCSKTQKTIDVKTSWQIGHGLLLENIRNINLKKVDYYVAVYLNQANPTNKKDINNIVSGTIKGFVTHKDLIENKSYYSDETLKYPYNKLQNANLLLQEFYDNDLKPSTQATFQNVKVNDILSGYIVVPWDISENAHFNFTKRIFQSYPHVQKIVKQWIETTPLYFYKMRRYNVFSDLTLAINPVYNSTNNVIDIQALIRNIKYLCGEALMENKKVYVPIEVLEKFNGIDSTKGFYEIFKFLYDQPNLVIVVSDL